MTRIIITGADGFLGSHLVDSCIGKDYEVYALKNPTGKINNLSHYHEGKKEYSKSDLEVFLGEKIKIPSNHSLLKILECDIRNEELIEKIIIEVKPKDIFHFAAQPYVIPSWEDPANTIETNVIGTINVFEPLKNNNLKSRVVVACSSAEYGTTTELKRPLKETDPVLAVHPYGISKITAELLARQYYLNFNIESIILRFFNQTGPRKTNDATSDFVQKVAKIELGHSKPEIQVGNLDAYRDIMGIKDSLQAIWLAAEKGQPGQTYNVCSNRKILIRDLLNKAVNLTSKKVEIIENTPEKLRHTDEDIIWGDNNKIKQLGFKISQTIDDLLRETYEYWLNYYKERKIS